MRPKWGTVSEDEDGYPFLDKRDALYAALDKEAEMRRLTKEWEGPVPDPSVSFDEWMRMLRGQRRARGERDHTAGAVTLQVWVETRWLPAQDVEESSLRSYRQHLERRIFPAFGDWPVNALTDPEEIAIWDKQLRARYATNTIDNTRNLLATILADARSAGLVDVNAAARRRRRGRVAERRKARVRTGRAWITPLQVLLLAERCAALTGRDDDFALWVTAAWCGLRWGELMAVRAEKITGGKLHVDAQLSDAGGGRYLLRDPKDGSIRNDDPAFFGAVDLPPFLRSLLARQADVRPKLRCGCDGGCGSGGFLFLNADGSHIDPGVYDDFPWPHACHGIVPGGDGRPDRPVLVDMAAGWPGVSLRPAWPVAQGPHWQPPRGRGVVPHDLPAVDALAVACPVPACQAPPLVRCTSRSGLAGHLHRPRIAQARAQGHVTERELACWLPIRRGLTPHGLRHSLRVWMDEDGVPEILKYDRLGHAMSGIGGTYAHVSEAMRAELVAGLQQRWETALEQRAAMSPTSTVGVLAGLLGARVKAGPAASAGASPNRLPNGPGGGPSGEGVDGAADAG